MKKQFTALLMVFALVFMAGCSKKMVEITIPAEIFANADKDQLEKEAKESGVKEVIVNDDGSVTYKMEESVQKKMLEEFKTGLDEVITTLTAGDSAVASFKEITYNDDMTEFTVKCDSQAYTETDSYYSVSFTIVSGMYQLFSGKKEASDVIVNFVDSETGDVLNSINSADLAQ